MTATVRLATAADHPWIEALLHSGAREGHFGEMVGAQAPAILDAVARFGGLPMMKARQDRLTQCVVRTDLFVADQLGTPAAFLLCLNDADGYELHLSGTQPQFRQMGCFNRLINHAINHAPAGSRIFARCYKPSTVAMVALQHRGFVITQPGDPDEFTLLSAA